MEADDQLDGLLVVDKPIGWSSMDVVRRVRRAIAAGRAAAGLAPRPLHKLRVGHAGTLDPLATGVVVCCLGRSTRQVERIMALAKAYEASIDLSAFTATDDREAAPEPVSVAEPPSPGVVDAALSAMVGPVQQRPPRYSAVHVAGRRAYDLARRGEAVTLPTRTVRIDAIRRIDYDWPLLSIRVTCGRGTYIRSLARDIGMALGTGGHLASLRRTAVGPFNLEVAIPPRRLDAPLTQADVLDPASWLA